MPATAPSTITVKSAAEGSSKGHSGSWCGSPQRRRTSGVSRIRRSAGTCASATGTSTTLSPCRVAPVPASCDWLMPRLVNLDQTRLKHWNLAGSCFASHHEITPIC